MSLDKLVGEARDWTIEMLANEINAYSQEAETDSLRAHTAVASAVVNAWVCGKLLNEAKTKLDHGDFGNWRDTNLDKRRVGERTSQRYMQLADQHDNVKDLLRWAPSLRQAYIACGILPEPERSVGEADGKLAPKSRALLTSLKGLEKTLRLFSGSGEKLVQADLTRLKLMRDELNLFFEKVIPVVI